VSLPDTAAEAGQVRTEDSFDEEGLRSWLKARLDLPEQMTTRQYGGGASNLTYLLEFSQDGESRDLILRTPPRGTKAASAHDMGREFRIQQALRPHFPAVPQVLLHCQEEDSPIGREFYVMERADGVIMRGEVASAAQDPVRARQLGLELFELLADLHSVDVEAAGLTEFYRGPGYVQRQVEGWSRRYRRARTEDVPDAEEVMSWLAANQPVDSGRCLIHGDWRFDNLVVDPETLQPVAALDWELATVGDPLMDLGSALAYWVQGDDDEAFRAFRLQPSNAPGMPSREQIVEHYQARTGREVGNWTFYEVFGLFRLAVIAQQIWYRYSVGETSNPAFAPFGQAVRTLVSRCQAKIASS